MRALVSTYILRSDPKLSCIGNTPDEALPYFGPMGASKIIPSSKRTVAPSFIGDLQPAPGDFILTIPTSKLELDLFADHNPLSKRYKGKKPATTTSAPNAAGLDTKSNPNKLLYNAKLSSMCYEVGGKKKYRMLRSNTLVRAPKKSDGEETRFMLFPVYTHPPKIALTISFLFIQYRVESCPGNFLLDIDCNCGLSFVPPVLLIHVITMKRDCSLAGTIHPPCPMPLPHLSF